MGQLGTAAVAEVEQAGCAQAVACKLWPHGWAPPGCVTLLPLQITDLLGTPGSERVLLREDKQAGVFLEGVGWHTVASGEPAGGWDRLAASAEVRRRADGPYKQCSSNVQAHPARLTPHSTHPPTQPTAATAPAPAVEEVLRLLVRGAASRHTATTRLNDTSSRSHMLLQCRIESQSVEEGTGVVRRRSTLSLVDLAGKLLQCCSPLPAPLEPFFCF